MEEKHALTPTAWLEVLGPGMMALGSKLMGGGCTVQTVSPCCVPVPRSSSIDFKRFGRGPPI